MISKTVTSLYIFTLRKYCSRLYKSPICVCTRTHTHTLRLEDTTKPSEPCLSSNMSAMRAHHCGRSDEEGSIGTADLHALVETEGPISTSVFIRLYLPICTGVTHQATITDELQQTYGKVTCAYVHKYCTNRHKHTRIHTRVCTYTCTHVGGVGQHCDHRPFNLVFPHCQVIQTLVYTLQHLGCTYLQSLRVTLICACCALVLPCLLTDLPTFGPLCLALCWAVTHVLHSSVLS